MKDDFYHKINIVKDYNSRHILADTLFMQENPAKEKN